VELKIRCFFPSKASFEYFEWFFVGGKRRGSGRAPGTRPNKIDPGTTDAGMIWYDLGNKCESRIIYIPV
jgi:hypothetical protein